MRVYLGKMFGISLALTVVVELIVAFVVRFCVRHVGKARCKAGDAERLDQQDHQPRPVWGSKRHMALLVVLVNVLTNPAAVLLCWLERMFLPSFFYFPVEILVEIAVVAVEARIYCSFKDRPGWQIGRPVLLSVVANGCSWILGMACGTWIDQAVTVILWLVRAW